MRVLKLSGVQLLYVAATLTLLGLLMPMALGTELHEFWVRHWVAPRLERDFGFSADYAKVRINGSDVTAFTLLSVQPSGELYQAGFRAGDVPVGYAHGFMTGFYEDLDAASHGTSVEIAVIPGEVLRAGGRAEWKRLKVGRSPSPNRPALPSVGAFSHSDAVEHTPSPAVLMAEIQRRGAKAVLTELAGDEDQFAALCSAVETGTAEWLEVARLLRPASDAAVALALDYSVARALPKAPTRVLRLIGHGFELEDVCTSPIIEPQPGVAAKYERAALKALRRLNGTGLGAVAGECSARVRLLDKQDGWPH